MTGRSLERLAVGFRLGRSGKVSARCRLTAGTGGASQQLLLASLSLKTNVTSVVNLLLLSHDEPCGY